MTEARGGVRREHIDKRWVPAIFKIRTRITDKGKQNYAIAAEKALWVIENIRIHEFNEGRIATISDLAKQMNETTAGVGKKLTALEEDDIIQRVKVGRQYAAEPHPSLPVAEIERFDPNDTDMEVVYMGESMVDYSHFLPHQASSSEKIDPKAGKIIDQYIDLAINTQMKLIVDHHRALRDEIWDRLGERAAKKALTIMMAQVLDVMVGVGETNDWMPIQALADASGGTLSWASKLTTDLEQLGIVEKSRRASGKGLRGGIALTRLSPDFLSAVQSRSLPSFSSETPTEPTAPSSNAPSTSDTQPA